MSHTTVLKSISIKDESALVTAIAELGKAINCSLLENVKPRMYYQGQGDVCRYVLNLVDCKYDVGFAKQEDNTFVPVFDEWGGIVKNQIGATCPLPVDENGNTTQEQKAQHAIGKFMQLYSKHALINAAIKQGYEVENTVTDENGNIQLLLNVY